MKKFCVQLTKEPYNFKYFSTLTDVRKLNYTYTEQFLIHIENDLQL